MMRDQRRYFIKDKGSKQKIHMIKFVPILRKKLKIEDGFSNAISLSLCNGFFYIITWHI